MDMCLKQLRIAVTGGIGCGKSEVGCILENQGFAVCDTDQIARELLEPDEMVYKQVLDEFGNEILGEKSGRISRQRLAEQIFGDDEKREKLNALMHPEIRKRWREWVEEQCRNGRDVAVQIPLLFEVQDEGFEWDAIICVSASFERVLQRLQSRGMSEQDVHARVKAQMDLKEKEIRSDYVICNDAGLDDLRCRTMQVLQAIRKEKGRND